MRLKVDGLGLELANNGVEVECEVAGSVLVFGFVSDSGGGDGVRWQSKVVENALSHFEAANHFCAGPMEETVEVAAFGKLEHDFGNVASRAGLAHFVGKEFGMLSIIYSGEEFLMDTSGTGGAVAHEDGNTQNNGVFFVMFKDFAFGHKFGLPVEIGRGGHVSGAVGIVALAIKDHVGGDMDEAGSEVRADLGEVAGEVDVYFAREFGLGIDGFRVREGGTVYNDVGPELEDAIGQDFGLSGIETEVFGDTGQGTGLGMAERDEGMPAT